MDTQSLFESGAANRSVQIVAMLNNLESDDGDDNSKNYNLNMFVYKSIYYITFYSASFHPFTFLCRLFHVKKKLLISDLHNDNALTKQEMVTLTFKS